MIVVLMPEAEETVFEIFEFIDSINLEDSSDRWLIKFAFFLRGYAKPHAKYALCANEQFAQEGYSCITYYGWVIAFRIKEDTFVVEKIVRGSILA